MNLLQIVPRLPPRLDGIGDHAVRLAERLRNDHDINTSFLVCDPSWEGPNDLNGFRIERLAARRPEVLYQMLRRYVDLLGGNPLPLLLQFAPYGYASRGCPFWLIQGLRRWTLRHNDLLITMFHELEAERGRPWSSPFWLSPLQRNLIRRLAEFSSHRLTNTEFHRKKLEAWRPGEVTLLPSFSTIGEPEYTPPVSERRRQVVVFGRAWQRKLAYSEGVEALQLACNLVGADTIIDIGQPLPADKVPEVLGIPIRFCGMLASSEVSTWMQSSLASFIYYPDALLTKSSVYAASCAHGTIPFVASDCAPSMKITELHEGQDYISLSDHKMDRLPLDLQQLSADVYSRYQSRDSKSAAKQIALITQLLS